MNLKNSAFLSLLIFIITGLISCKRASEKQTNVAIKPGQIYRAILNEDNPYSKPLVIDYRVLEVNKGYVLYVRDEKDTLSESETVFLWCVKLIKE